MGQTKQRVNKTNARQRGKDAAGNAKPGEEAFVISAGVWGQLAPLDKIAREKTAKWGDTLPSLVAPELAGRFEAAYERLKELVEANDVVGVNKVAAQLMRAWDVLEQTAEAAGHKPLPPHAYCVEIDGGITCFAMHGWAELRKKHPTWTVYSFEDAARLLRFDWTERMLNEAYSAFPEAKVTRVVRDGDSRVNWDLGGDDIPF